METIYVNPAHPGFYYAAFYTTAVVMTFIILTWEASKRKFPLLPWWLMIATALLFFMIGTQFIKFGYSEWRLVLRLERITIFPGRSVLGGIVFGVMGLIIAKQLLRFPYRVVDTFALVVPLGLAVQRVGCFMAGCCFGSACHLPWAVQYNSSSPAFRAQVFEQLISATAIKTMPVHPVQLYDLVCCVVVFFLLRLKFYLKQPGSLLGVSLFLYGCCRFFLEFVRAESTLSPIGLTYVQLVLLVIIPALAFWIPWNERRQHNNSVIYLSLAPIQYYGYLLIFISFFVFFSRWMSPLEILTLNVIVVPILVLAAVEVFKSVVLPAMRGVLVGLVVVALLTMNQTLPDYSKSDSTRKSYNIFSTGLMSGTAGFTYTSDPNTCNGPPVPVYQVHRNNQYSATAIGFSRTVQYAPFNSITFGMNGFAGDHVLNYDSAQQVSAPRHFGLAAINPFVLYNWDACGLGFGIYAGNLSSITNSDPPHVTQPHVVPAFSIRVGRLRKLHFEYRRGFQFPSPFPVIQSQFSIGHGFGSRRGGGLRIGTASNVGFFIAPTIPVGNYLVIEGMVGGGGSMYAPRDQNSMSSFYSLNLHYKFGMREQPAKSATKPK